MILIILVRECTLITYPLNLILKMKLVKLKEILKVQFYYF